MEPSADTHAGDTAGDELSELLAEVRRIEVQSRRLLSGTLASGYATVFRGAGLELRELREYVEGDDPRSIDWNVTARTGRLHVRTYVDERGQTLLLLLDLSRSMDGGAGPWSLRQTAARVLACLALSAVGHEDRVGLVAFGERVEHVVPPGKGLPHALRIVRDALALPSAPGDTRLAPALQLAARLARRRAVVFVLSDFLSVGREAELSRCARRHDVVAVRLLPPELSLPSGGLLRLVDPESGRRHVVDAGSPSVRARWQAQVAAWRRRGEEALARAGADLVDVPLPSVPDRDAIARPLLRFFRMRERRSRHR